MTTRDAITRIDSLLPKHSTSGLPPTQGETFVLNPPAPPPSQPERAVAERFLAEKISVAVHWVDYVIDRYLGKYVVVAGGVAFGMVVGWTAHSTFETKAAAAPIAFHATLGAAEGNL